MENKKAYRPKWDHYFMTMAIMVAQRSTCDRLLGGSVLVRDKRVIGTGYNGSPSGLDHCDDVGHLMHEGHCIRTLHSEENTLIQAAKLGIMTEGSTIYATFSPCYHCLKKLIAAGVKKIVVGQIYRDTRIFETCMKAGVQLEVHCPDPNWLDHLSELYRTTPRSKPEEIKLGDVHGQDTISTRTF